LCSPCVTPARWMHGHIPADPPSTSCGACRSAAGFFQPDSRQSACLATVQLEGCYQDAYNATGCKLCEANTRTYKGTGVGTNRSECMCALPSLSSPMRSPIRTRQAACETIGAVPVRCQVSLLRVCLRVRCKEKYYLPKGKSQVSLCAAAWRTGLW
jgi:hypothetical protein